MLTKILKLVSVNCILLFAACNSNNTSRVNTDSPTATSNDSPRTALAAPLAIEGTLDTLWVDSGTFSNLPKGKLVLQYLIEPSNAVTLKGWSVKGANGFDPPPNIKLVHGRSSGIKFGPGNYFGDLVLKGDEVKKIKKDITDNKSKYVLFAPQMSGSHIQYEIFITSDNPGSLVKEFLVAPKPTGFIANPSPPRSFD